jgi:hypothetical protein
MPTNQHHPQQLLLLRIIRNKVPLVIQALGKDCLLLATRIWPEAQAADRAGKSFASFLWWQQAGKSDG